MSRCGSFLKVVMGLLLIGLSSASVADGKSPREQAMEAYIARDYLRSGRLFVEAAEHQDVLASDHYYSAARGFALAGAIDEAFSALERAAAWGFQNAWTAKREAAFASLHGDPRWRAFLERIEAKARAGFEFWNNPAMHPPFKENLSEEEKIAGLSKLWAEAKYNFIHFDKVPSLNWDGVYMEYLPKVRATKSTLEYYRVLMTMYALLQDGHTEVSLPRQLAAAQYSRPLLRTGLVEGKAVIVAVGKELAGAGLMPGLEIVQVDGIPVKEYAEQNAAYQSASTSQDRDSRIYRGLLEGPHDKPVEVTLRDASGGMSRRMLERLPYSAEQWKEFQREPMTWKMLPGNVAHVVLNAFDRDHVAADRFEAALPEIAKADGLVIDLRENAGGYSSDSDRVLACLTDKEFDGLKWATRNYPPVFRSWGWGESRYIGPVDGHKPNGDLHFAKPVVALTSPRTYSSAEYFVATFRMMKRGKIIGEPTGGSTGSSITFPLPGGGGARVCVMDVKFPDGMEFVGAGIQPDVAVSPTIADLRAGRDAVLEAALNVLDDEMKR